jgi:hypothetical protein
LAVLGGDAIDPRPAPLDPLEPRRQQFRAGHVVLVEGPGRLQDARHVVTDQNLGVRHGPTEKVGGERMPEVLS